MTQLAAAEVAAKLIEVSKTLRLDAERAIALRSFFNIGQEPTSIAAVNAFGGADAAELLRGAVLESIVLAVLRMCDPGGSDKHTISRARELAEAPGVTETFSGQDSEQAFVRFAKSATELESLDAHKKLRAMRNYAVAHKIPTKFQPSGRPLFEDLWKVLELAVEAVGHLGVATQTVGVSMGNVAEVWDARNRFYSNKLISK